MKNPISIALVQNDLQWKDKQANLKSFEALINAMQEPADLIVLPETFNTGFCIDDTSLAENENGKTIAWLKNISCEKNSAICGSMLFEENGKIYNRFLFISNGEIISHYNKHHLFSLVGEHASLTRGTNKSIIEYKEWKIQPFICYDLRFPAWCQNDANADIQLYVANWPEKRIHHWSALLRARAIENQCYVVGVNRIGKDFYNNDHNGYSAVFDATGSELCSMEGNIGMEIVKLSPEDLKNHRNRYPFWKDRDTFEE